MYHNKTKSWAMMHQKIDNDTIDPNVATISAIDMEQMHAGNAPATTRSQPLSKDVLDFSLIILFSPILLVTCAIIAIAIRLDSAGSVIFKQTRTGLNGKRFTIYKFRTMVPEAGDDLKAPSAFPGDPRQTRLGKWLRKTSLDELPQVINVLKGEMSLVGPRPHALHHDHIYSQSVKHYMQRFQMKPGITGLAQVQGWRGLVDSHEHIQARTDADNRYIANWSLLSDIKILLLSVWVVIKTTNAH